MLPPDPMFPPQPYWNRRRIVALFLGIWYVLIAAILFRPAAAMQMAAFSCLWTYFLWSPFEFNPSHRLDERSQFSLLRTPENLLVNVLLWIIFLIPAAYYIYYAINIDTTEPEVPPVYRFESDPM